MVEGLLSIGPTPSIFFLNLECLNQVRHNLLCRGQSIPSCCRRKVYRREIYFSQSAFGNVQSSFLSFPPHHNNDITHGLTDSWHAFTYVNSAPELSQLVWRLESDQSFLVMACVSIRCRQELAWTGLSQAFKQTRAELSRLVLAVAGSRGDTFGRWGTYSCRMWSTLSRIKRA